MMARKLLLLTFVWVAVLAFVQAPSASASAFRLEIFGAGHVIDQLPSEGHPAIVDCTSSNTTPTGVSGATCDADLPGFWTFSLTATPLPGYRFDSWIQGGKDQVTCSGGATANPCTWTVPLWGLYLGAKFVDDVAPDTSILSAPAAATNSTSATFGFASDQAGSTFQCSLDFGAFSSCTSSQSYSGLSSGPHNFQVKAIDPSGNIDFSPAAYNWSVDAIAPETTITSGPSGTVSLTSATFEFSSSEPNSTFQCSLDGSTFSFCMSPAAYSVGEGAHTFQVKARDAVGNVDPSPATRSWTVQLVASGTKTVSVTDSGYSPKALGLPAQGYTAQWNFASTNTRSHTATDASGMGLFDSGLKAGGTNYSFTFKAAGTYKYKSTASEPTLMAGTVKVPLKVSPLSGGTTTTYTVTWASGAPATGFFSDVAYRYKPCAKTATCTWQAWTNWKTNQTSALSAGFTPTKGTGTYQFRARVGKQVTATTKKFSGWSLPVTVSVA